MEHGMLTLEKFEEASEVVKKVTQETKLVYSDFYSAQTGGKVYLKPENMQFTGAYKLRGAYYKLSTLSDQEREKGLITASAGNHAQGVAYAARCYGVRAVIVMPTTTPLIKVNRTKNLKKTVDIAPVGKYISLHDAYISVVEALKHAGIANNAEVHIKWVDSETVTEENVHEILSDVTGILVPGGFGDRGINGKIIAIKYARENRIPFLGLCLGMQLSIVEYARNVLGYEDAHSVELNPQTTHPVIHLMPDQDGIEDIGGTLRLGSYPCVLDKTSKAYEVYGEETIHERHRHRYEVNNDYRNVLTEHGVKLSGISPDGRIVEMIEIEEHPWFVATQAHPELKSRPNRPHPLFKGFVRAAVEHEKR